MDYKNQRDLIVQTVHLSIDKINRIAPYVVHEPIFEYCKQANKQINENNHNVKNEKISVTCSR